MLVCVVTIAALAAAGTSADFPDTSGAAAAPTSAPSVTRPVGPSLGPTVHYAFEEMRGGQPVRFDSCAPVAVRYDPSGEPYSAATDIAEAVRRLSSGLGRPVGFQTGGSVDGPAVSVSWVTVAAELAGDPRPDTIGTGGFSSAGATILSGAVSLAADGHLAPGFGRRSWGGIYLHELGHAVGLAHVDDPAEAMYPTVVHARAAEYGPGDLAGLAQLGGTCAPAKASVPTGGSNRPALLRRIGVRHASAQFTQHTKEKP